MVILFIYFFLCVWGGSNGQAMVKRKCQHLNGFAASEVMFSSLLAVVTSSFNASVTLPYHQMKSKTQHMFSKDTL